MKKQIIRIVLVLFSSLLNTNATNNHYQTANKQNNVFEAFNVSPDEDLFEFDDSLLITMFPEVGVKCQMSKSTNTIFSHSMQFHCTPNDNNHQDYLIIVNQSLFTSISSDIIRYAEDVHAIYGYGVIIEIIANDTPEDIKSLILIYQNNLCGVLLIGNISEAFFETSNDHNKYGYRYWPCDLYFMDLNGVWTDSDNNGRYDLHTGNTSPEIFVGRLSATGMSSIGNETTLIQMQLQKTHNFWWRSSYSTSTTVLNYIDKDWADDYFSTNTISPVFSSGNVVDIRYGVNTSFSPSNYVNNLSNTQYGFTQLAAHSSPTSHCFTNGYVELIDIKQNTSNNYAYNLFCCSACNWTQATSQGYLGGAYLFNNGKTMVVVGSTKTGGMWETTNFYSQFSSQNIGNAFLNWWISTYGNNHTNSVIWWSYGMVLLGDPTINFRHEVSNVCTNNLVLNTFPTNNCSNLIIYKAAQSISVSGNFVIPQGVHVVFDAPQVSFADTFNCPIGASFETRSEGCEL